MKKICMLAFLIFMAMWQISFASDDPVAIVEETFNRYRLPVYEEEEVSLKTSAGRDYELKKFSHFSPQMDDKIMVKFQGSEKGTAIRILFEGDNVSHLYRKGKRVRKIKIQEEQCVLDTDITQEDLQRLFREDTRKYDYRIIATGKEGWQIEALPKSGLETGYKKRILHINRDHILRKVEYFVISKQLDREEFVNSKTLTNDEIVMEGGAWRPMRSTIANHLEGSQTQIKVKKRKIFDEINEGAFKESFLENDRSNP